jgi:hypothetical protein
LRGGRQRSVNDDEVKDIYSGTEGPSRSLINAQVSVPLP